MHRHETVRGLLRGVISKVDLMGAHEFSDTTKRMNECENITDDLERAYSLIMELKREFEEEKGF